MRFALAYLAITAATDEDATGGDAALGAEAGGGGPWAAPSRETANRVAANICDLL
jgi:hypothetical protein